MEFAFQGVLISASILAGLRGCNDFESSILVLQRNSKAVTSSQLFRYFQRVADVDGEVEIQPILRPTDIMKVKMLPVTRKIHIASTIVDAMTTLENIDENTRHGCHSCRQRFRAAVIDKAWRPGVLEIAE